MYATLVVRYIGGHQQEKKSNCISHRLVHSLTKKKKRSERKKKQQKYKTTKTAEKIVSAYFRLHIILFLMCFGGAHIHFGRNEMNTKEHSIIIISIWEQQKFSVARSTTVYCMHCACERRKEWLMRPSPPPYMEIQYNDRPSSHGVWRMGGPFPMYFARAFSIQDQRRNKTTCASFFFSFFSAAGFNVYNLCILFISYITHACIVQAFSSISSGNSIASLGEKISFEYYKFFSFFFFWNSYVCVCAAVFSRFFLSQIDWSNTAVQKWWEGEHSMAKV